ncbi:probable LRR receptor-like serine/threonine-protein kinase At1g56130 [Magnolia sinica]|uniref:probable LRR receptor-like serine/threonine-protein kinase At1g56130 n=1 Tax=Magnolia sinica TaxID=86752 RepID=UPI00265B0B7D|nr:probable LRR receptor-like serine/threonine-protein kinase At1g56130 [Magnolia sinica]
MKRSTLKSPSHILLASCFWCIHLLCLVERCKVHAQTNFTTDPDEARALNAIFQRWGFSVTGEWNISGDPCSGTAVNSSTISNPGIKCDCQSNGGGTCHIIEMKVYNQGVQGAIPEELSNLISLTKLDLSYNNIEGSLPAFIGSFRHLRYLDIRDNNFNGSLPPEIGTLPSLEHLDVSDNNITGPFPAFIGNITSMLHLNVQENYMTGPLPASIGNLRNLSFLSVGMNAISGSIPKELGNLRNLISLNIGSNNFTGSLPPELGNLTSLQILYIDSCGLSGQIPSTFARLRNLNALSASDNNFTGIIPDFIGSWALTYLGMQGNAFEGPIPSSFSNLTSLNYLSLSDVSNGSSSLNFIVNMTSLRILVLKNNMLFGTIPSTIENLQSLKHMDLSFNNLSGPIPASLFNISSLANLFLGNNSLSGTLPSQKRNTLLNIDLSYNYLSGSFPSWVSEEVSSLNLVFNNFIFNDFNSSGLPLSLNCLQRSFPCSQKSPIQSSFAIRCGGPPLKTNDTGYEGDNEPLGPSTFKASTDKWAVSNVGIFAARTNGDDIIGNSSEYNRHTEVVFRNTTDSKLFQYARLSPGSLRYYGLGLENGNYTVNLKFAETEFPDSETWKRVGKRVFDIYLQGNLAWKDFDIKKEAGIAFKGIEKTQWVMVYEHILEIHLLWAGKGTFCIPSGSTTYGPAISAIHVTPNFEPVVGTRRKKNKIALAAEILASVVLSIVSVSVFLIWKRSKRSSVDEGELLRMGPRPNTFSHRELKTATEDFSPANKLGQGGFGPVFKGTLLDGRMVAVKRLSVTSRQGKSQFLAEIAAISAVQHRNLVKLYGCCIKGANRLLVYEYLENKSLDQALIGESNLHLEWHTRFEICLGTARGLAYLHEESRPRIVHRDVKASNILLDANLNPKISDFGLAKLYDDKMSHISTGVAGTIGYIAPEYAMRGHLTEKADIFGFGVVALEIVSGRANPCENVYPENMYLVEWAWHLHENNRALELVDPTLSNFDAEEAARMIGIGLLCIQASPSLRPPMSRVVAMLQGDIEVSTVTSKPGYLTDLPPNFTSSFMSDGTLTASTSVTSSSQKLSPANESISPCEPLSLCVSRLTASDLSIHA